LLFILHAILADDCSFSDYNEDGDYTSNGVPDSIAVPTYFGSVSNEAGQVVKFQKNHCYNVVGATRCALDTRSLLSVTSVEPTNIAIVPNAYWQSTVKNDITISGSDLFEIANNDLKLTAAYNMKDLGGPRHEITLRTTSGCTIKARVMIQPTESSPTKLEFESTGVDDKIVDGLPYPATHFMGTGKLLELRVKEYSNIQCGVVLSKSSGTSSIYKLDDLKLKVTHDGDEIETLYLNQDSARCDETFADCENIVDELSYPNFDGNPTRTWDPQAPACQFIISFKPEDEMKELFYEEYSDSPINYEFSLYDNPDLSANKADWKNFGYRPRIYSGLNYIPSLDDSEKVRRTEAETTQVAVEIFDLDNMPPVFNCKTDKCIEGVYHSAQTVSLSLSDCLSSSSLFNMGGDVEFSDGDTGDAATTVSIEHVKVYDSENNEISDAFEIDGGEVKQCKADVEDGPYVVEYKVVQDDLPELRYAFYHHVINVGEPASVSGELIEQNNDAEWAIDWLGVHGGNFYIVNLQDDSERLQFSKKDGIEGEVWMASKTPGFTVDTDGYVICTMCTGYSDDSTSFADEPLEIWAFNVVDGMTKISEQFTSTVNTNSINLVPPATTTEATTTVTTRGPITEDECKDVCEDFLDEICEERNDVDQICEDWIDAEKCEEFQEEICTPEVCEDVCIDVNCPDQCTEEECEDLISTNPDLCDSQKDEICKPEEICTPDICEEHKDVICKPEEICTPETCEEFEDQICTPEVL